MAIIEVLQNLHAFLVGLGSDGGFERYKFTNVTANYLKDPERIDEFPTFDELKKQRITTLELKLPGCHSDQTIGKDLLGIFKEVEAVSTLLSMKQVENLAIGLFGNWGSGKSFFMNKVQEQLERQMKTESSNVFYKNIIQIEFNAWHFTSHIFEEIQKKLKENKTGVEELIEQLPSIKGMSDELKELEKRNDIIAFELKVNKTLTGQKLPPFLEEWIEHVTLLSRLKENLAKAGVFFKRLTHLPKKDWIKLTILGWGLYFTGKLEMESDRN